MWFSAYLVLQFLHSLRISSMPNLKFISLCSQKWNLDFANCVIHKFPLHLFKCLINYLHKKSDITTKELFCDLRYNVFAFLNPLGLTSNTIYERISSMNGVNNSKLTQLPWYGMFEKWNFETFFIRNLIKIQLS